MSSRGRHTRSRARGDGWDVWGGYMNAKKQKLQEQFSEDTPGQLKKEGSGSKIFSGISIHVNGYTKPSSDELKRLMMLHGGAYEHYLYRTRVTHVIATNLPNSKVKELKGLKVVKPEWITDSIAAGKLLSYTKYLLYTAQSGLQKGLQTYATSRQNSEQSESSVQSINSINSDTAASSDCSPSSKNSMNNDSSRNSSVGGDSDSMGDTTSVVNKGKNNFHTADASLKEISPGKGNASIRKEVLSPGKTGDARDPKFLNEFYSNSRLHFLSTWKAEWKNYVNELQSKGDNFTGREKLHRIVQERAVTPDEDMMSVRRKGKPKRCIMHIDMDCFFVSVGLRKRPDLRGKPVAVTHSRGKGSVPDPESDLNFERHQWELKKLQGGRKGKKGAQHGTTLIADDDSSFPDQSDSDSDGDDVIDDVNTVSKTATEPFHSMAEIASCSYEARQAGVRNGMFMGKAKAICPDLVTIPYDFEGYKTVSKILYDTVASYTHDIEAVSCDEMLVDCTDLLADTGATPTEFASLLRTEIYEKTECPASAGLGSSILLARMATRKAKPNGQFYLTEDLVADYIKIQPVKDLPGVGWSTTKRFEVMKVVTCGDLQRVSLGTLQKEFGPKTGQLLYRYCRGQDDRPIKMEQQRKSVSAEVNYGIRFTTDAEAVNFMEELSEEVCNRLKNIKMKGKTITLKLMVRRQDAPKQTAKFMGHGICTNYSKSASLPMATDDPRIVAKETIGLLRSHKVDASDLRGIGIQVQKLEMAEIGIHGNTKKVPSILNYTVNKSAGGRAMTSGVEQLGVEKDRTGSLAAERSMTGGLVLSEAERHRISDLGHRTGSLGQSEAGTAKTGCLRRFEKEKNVSGKLSERESDSSASTIKVQFTKKADISIHGLSETGTVNSEISVEDKIKTKNTSRHDGERKNCKSTATVEPEISVLDVGEHSDIVEGQLRLDEESGDFLEELGRRHRAGSSLPPLPSLPNVKTPESTRKSGRGSDMGTSVDILAEEPPEIDYFPSPSQVDPCVLKELPADIREQIESELKQRRKKRSTSSKELSAPSCSYWQPETGGSTSVIEEIQKDADPHSNDAIVALPSPSQIDPSCLEALPAALQAELRQAYARQNTSLAASAKGGNTLQLKQAKSPSKSPNKRSTSKGSPNFKVPRGRPGKRGRPKGSSKKTLFKDQTKLLSSNANNYSHHGNSRQGVEILESEREETTLPTMQMQSGSAPVVTDYTVDNLTSVNQSYSAVIAESGNSCHGNGVETDNSVNLCGAVTIQDVRQLLKEWITSTPAPQLEDEEVLQRYLADLVADRNLEQVDLLLKYMHRRINDLQNSDWLLTLKRIFHHTQAAVYELYGSRLMSVAL